MSKIDQFESLFRAAVQPRYQPNSYALRELLVLTDLPTEQDTAFLAQLEPFFAGLSQAPKLTLIPREQSQDLGALLTLIEGHGADLICTYRNLHSAHGDSPYTLGGHVEVLTQACSTPILLMPRPEQMGGSPFSAPSRVMALTDHFDDHPQLIDAAVAMLKAPGTLVLSHVEDEATFERYMSVIAKIPSIDTDEARALIKAQLLRDAEGYLARSKEALLSAHQHLEVITEVSVGHHLKAHTALVEARAVELLVINTKDEDQLAMHGLSHPIAIELRDLPLLML